ncbi:MAG: ATP-binding protein [Bacteroidota bacterium]
MSHFFRHGEIEGYIMVVEDSLMEATMLKHLLKQHGYKVKVYHEGAEAFSAASVNIPMLIISDVLMPVMDGYEFCEKLKSTPKLMEVPIILLTSLQDPLDIIHGLQAGADNFITKPFESKYLLSRVNYLLANRELRSAGNTDLVLEIMFKGNKYAINSERKQILDLLLSVYETSIEQNKALIDAQKQLQQANEHLANANSDLESFSYTISHDLRTPLNHISVSTQLIQQRHEKEFNEEDNSYLNTILTTVRSMADMISDLLQFSRSGNIKVDHKKVDLTDLTKKVIEWTCQDNPDRKIKFVVEEGIFISGDSSLLMVVMKNLLSNAWKYTMYTADSEVHVGTQKNDDYTIVFVKDNGAGFDANQAGNLFTPFVRLHSQDDFPGTGVGLSTVRRIIERHGGKIWATGKVGHGATFFFKIPKEL